MKSSSLHAVPESVALRHAILASDYAERLAGQLNRFNAQLDAAHEVAVSLLVFGALAVIHITQIGAIDPGLVVFHGYRGDDRSPVRILQHVSQTNIMLLSLPREDMSSPKHPIGFRASEDED